MPIGVRYVNPFQTDINVNGVPYPGGKLYFYVTGTSTPQDTYSDIGLTVPNANPVIADDNGRWSNIWLGGSQGYLVTLTDANDVEVWTADPVGPGAGGASTNIDGIVGEVRMYAGIEAGIPAGWYLCYGQAVSRTDFSAAYSVLGTTWGSGDGSTTFNLPDLRGRVMAGKDNMGGGAANRLTAGVSGVPGTTLGGVGGDQASQIHDHAITDPEHDHVLTDLGHAHDLKQNNNITSGTSPTGPLATTGAASSRQSVDVYSATTGITIASAATGIDLATYGTGSSQNVQPTAVVNMIIYLGA